MKEQESAPGEEGGLFQRLVKRHVIQAAAIYVAVAWGALEILITLQEKLGWPESISVWATRLFVIGFPAAIILAWRRDLESRLARGALVGLAFVAAGAALWLTVSTEPAPDRAGPTLPPVSEAIATVAVLPFENGSGDPAYEYLANGFTGELIARLSKHPDLAVVQEESARAPMLASLIPMAKAAQLNADFLVQGRVLREEKFIEVTASLQDLDGNVLWSEVLREPYAAESVVAMQRRISGEVSRLLGTTLEAPAYCGETSDLEAMELYYRGRLKVGTRVTETMEEGMELLKQAVEEDPYFGRGWAMLGSAQLVLSERLLEPPDPDRERGGMLRSMSLTAFRRALDICPTIGWAYKVIVPSYEGIDNEAIDQEMQFRDALAMDPNDAALLRQYAIHLMQHGMNDEAVEALRRAYDNEPMMAMIPFQLGHSLWLSGRCDEAMPLAAKAEELGGQPEAAIGFNCAKIDGDVDAAIDAAEKFVTFGFDFPFKALGVSAAEFTRMELDENHPLRPVVREKMRALWEENPDPGGTEHMYWIVGTATQIGDLDLVFDILDVVANEDGFWPYTLAWSPLFMNSAPSSRLRSDPRFVEIVNRTGYPEYWRKFGWPTGCAPESDSFRCF